MVIRLKNVVKIYKVGEAEIRALNSVSLEIKKGEYVSIVGPSGSGKTTLFNVIGGLEPVDEGEIWVDDKPVHKLKEEELARLRREKLGFIFQDFYLLPTATALENVMMPQIGFKPTKEIRERAKMLLEKVGLKDRLHHLPSRLSGGERQRVAIARAFVTEPEVILADEPTGNLDSENSIMVIELLEAFHREKGTTILFITHNLDLANRAKRQINIRDGKIVRDEVR
ncbi:ABC transporter ATP-binding protein [Caldanaerobacter subterraneus]|uniref:ABC-type transport systems, involved in lipoprotein release, ATPase components n=1 Tax=Caldanaerobacter subterraneus subsp. tengcongensis (strain DSM 15242 / JCM 11007 / NBRC 100824 / MB4) TaxID=273068 RepID=Q8R6S7_CALS4|nr:ABC-type transport systems, involved in lipoprotein release, ATPase components [Caldanaerobacter subterraneus subsp. tengcongensis MB4]